MKGVGVCDVVRVGDCYTARIEYTKEVSPVGPQFLVNLLPLVLLERGKKDKSAKGGKRFHGESIIQNQNLICIQGPIGRGC